MNPSKISQIHPWSSVTQKMEIELIASNAVKILARTGDTFRDLPDEEYEKERKADAATDKSGFSRMEFDWLACVRPFLVSAEKAASFCKDWETALKP